MKRFGLLASIASVALIAGAMSAGAQQTNMKKLPDNGGAMMQQGGQGGANAQTGNQQDVANPQGGNDAMHRDRRNAANPPGGSQKMTGDHQNAANPQGGDEKMNAANPQGGNQPMHNTHQNAANPQSDHDGMRGDRRNAANPQGDNNQQNANTRTESDRAVSQRNGNDNDLKTGRSAVNPQGGARNAGGMNVTAEDRTKIKSEFGHVHIRQANNIDIRASVGVVAPHTVTEYWEPVPEEFVRIVPAWRSYRVVRIHDEILIIDPVTFKVVYIVEV